MSNIENIEDRLLKFKVFLEKEIINTGSKISEWDSAPTIKKLPSHE